MQAYNLHSGKYFFFLIFFCTLSISIANISPFHFRTQPLRILDIITTPNSLGKYFGHFLTAVRGISHANGFQNLLTRNIQEILERQAEKTEHNDIQQNTEVEPITVRPSANKTPRRRYDHNCFFTPVKCVILPRKLSHLTASAIRMKFV